MKRSGFTYSQIIGVLQAQDTGDFGDGTRLVMEEFLGVTSPPQPHD